MQIAFGVILTIFSLYGLITLGPVIMIVALLLGLVAALIARSKGKELMGWWLYGTMLSLIAIPHALILKKDQSRIDERALASGMKKCPDCAELVRAEAAKCKHCGHAFP